MSDLYSTLGVSREASADEIKRAYRKLAKELHPDLNPGDKTVEQRFKEINAAYSLLSDPDKRKRYDAGEIDAAGQEKPSRGFYRSYADAGMGQKYHGFDAEAAEDIFSDLFGGFGRSRRAGGRTPRQRGADVSYSVHIDFLEAANGARKRIQLADGKTVDVTIPAGTADGQTLRLKGQGLPGLGGAGAGDAYVEVHIAPHRFFTRKDSDIHLEVPVSLPEAVLGATISVPTVEGKVSMKVPAGANSGTTLRLKGKGTVDQKSGERGDQYVKLKVVLPEKPDAELQRFMESWGKEHGYDPRKKAGLA
ncbi:DnaJ-class molecular chaperone with C-terminal Zn finger domain [Tistlia consotensis]|uniref:DnaJ-class molecular chaperone with C-terminal Zn finger domain n=1 Tax=Tistlia consotensis USBA 355 TaxID=560819 RepID=A0A1Y6CKJ1_9PROT|nr:DnaJ C-terminal domain-containing protein [Tistlia consotensis]SMF60786.1 DnaJ-class molecular chaperone with C-terminal Zn finger domain [Tistlia consotensis USBA 355]SNR92717.1 DnaJ-class molecular chaperone with C-terminal Zn finger domain [Tistlia consotensis]